VTTPVSLPYFDCLWDIFHLLEPFFISHTIGPADLRPSPAPFFKFAGISDLLSEVSSPLPYTQ
jgi:hypothetical protein